MQWRAVAGEALDRRHLMTLGLDREHQARSHRRPVEQHRAAAADAVLAAHVRAGQAEVVAKVVGKKPARIPRRGMLDAVDPHWWRGSEVRRIFRGVGGRSQGRGGARRSAAKAA